MTLPSTLEHPELGSIAIIARPRTRHMRLRVIPFQGPQITVPPHASLKTIRRVIDSRLSWIKVTWMKVRKTERQSLDFFSRNSYPPRPVIQKQLESQLKRLASEYGFSYGKISIRAQHTRWGSCSATDTISLNRNLIFLPDHLRDYILLHELAHTRQKNHGSLFWEILFQILGREQVLRARRQLRDYSFLFYPPPE